MAAYIIPANSNTFDVEEKYSYTLNVRVAIWHEPRVPRACRVAYAMFRYVLKIFQVALNPRARNPQALDSEP